jgi:hypothetical protein
VDERALSHGIDFGGTGISFGDYDADGFIDVFAGFSSSLAQSPRRRGGSRQT